MIKGCEGWTIATLFQTYGVCCTGPILNKHCLFLFHTKWPKNLSLSTFRNPLFKFGSQHTPYRGAVIMTDTPTNTVTESESHNLGGATLEGRRNRARMAELGRPMEGRERRGAGAYELRPVRAGAVEWMEMGVLIIYRAFYSTFSRRLMIISNSGLSVDYLKAWIRNWT